MATRSYFPLPQRARGQGEGACSPPALNIIAPTPMQISPISGVLRRPLTPTLSPGGEGVVYVFGVRNG